MHFNYKDYLKKFSQENRSCPTKAEWLFWNCILKNDWTWYRFLRQKPVDWYILDFYCAKLRLGIEIDGESHEWKGDYDEERDLILSGLGIKIIRYSDVEVLKNFEWVHLDLESEIEKRKGEVNI